MEVVSHISVLRLTVEYNGLLDHQLTDLTNLTPCLHAVIPAHSAAFLLHLYGYLILVQLSSLVMYWCFDRKVCV